MRRSILVSLILLVSMSTTVLFPTGGHARVGNSPRATRTGPVSASADKSSGQPSTNLQGQPALDYLKEHGLYDRLSASIEQAEYEIGRAPRSPGQRGRSYDGAEVYTATNRAQNLSAQFSAGQVLLQPAQADCRGAMQLRLQLHDYGYAGRMMAAGPATTRVDGNRVEISRQIARKNPRPGEITEWYLNRTEGIEQGFTLTAPPGERVTGQPLRVRLRMTGKVRLVPVDSGKAVELTSEDGKVWLRYDHLTATDASGRELPARIEASRQEISLVIEDGNAVYPVQIDPLFTQTKKLTAGDAATTDQLGQSVGISGDTLVVGAAFKNTATGAAYVFGRNQGGADNWGQVKKLTAGDAATTDEFGTSVGISGDTVVVGANNKNSATGAAYVFGRNQGGADNWGQVKKLTAGDAATGDEFGISVGISGDTVVVGANAKNTNTGAAYLFGRNQGGADNWGQVKKLTAGDAATSDNFGLSVRIDGDTVVVGAFGKNTNTGAVYVFGRNQGGADNWGQVQKLTASDAASGDRFGLSVGISGDRVVVGAVTKNANAGAAYVFGRNQGGADNWGQVQKLTAGDAATNDQFGFSVGISGDTVVVGAQIKNSSTGAAYVFVRNQGGADNWGQVQKLTAGDAATNDHFGFSVGISGDTVVVGAIGKSSNTGAAYVFQSQCGQWSQTKKPTAGDAATSDRFGVAVGISGDTVVVGAQFKNSNTGAAYVFGRNLGGADNWGQVQKLTAGDAATGDFFGNSVGLSGDTVVVGARAKDSSTGAAYVFGRNQGGAENWGQVKKLTAGDAASGDQLGGSVGLSGDTVVVGAQSKNSGTGAAYVFGRNQGGADNWGQVKKLTAGDAATGDQFGGSVGLSGDTVVVGAFGKNSNTGAAYVFGRNQGGADSWGQVQKLTAGDAATNDLFGFSVGMSRDTVVVGAQSKNSGTGAAYVFGRNQGGADNWGQVKKLTAGDAATGDLFGVSVGLSGDTVVVGAYVKNASTGAAYVFGRNQGGADNWGQVQKLTAGDAATGDLFGHSVGISGDTVVVGADFKNSGIGVAYVFDLTCPPTITKQFGASSIPLNGTTSLSFAINNPNPDTTLNGIAFSDNLPAGLVVATPGNLSSNCGGTAIAADGSSSVSLTGGSIPAGGSCTISVTVKGTPAGVKNNTTGAISSTEGGTGTTSNTAAVTVVAPPAISKAFGAATIQLNSSTSLSFTINNPNPTTLNGIGFNDPLPAGLVVSTPNGLTGSCGGGAIVATAGSGSISLSGASLAASTQCTFSVKVTATAGGLQNNTTGNVTSTEGGTGATASASLTVCTGPTIVCPGSITKFADPGQFAATVNPGVPVTNSGCSGVTITGVRSDGLALNALYPIGVTMITWTAKDGNGNTEACSQSIVVMVPSGQRRP